MKDIFFDTNYTTFQDMLVRILVFLLVSGIFLYIIYFVLTKVLFKENKDRKEINLRIIFLWSLFTYLIVFNIYVFLLFYKNGIDSLNLSSARFYLGFIGQMTIYICVILYFFIKRYSLRKCISENSIN